MSSIIESGGKGVRGYWVRQQGLLGLVTRELLGIRSGGKGSKSGDNLGMSQNFMYVATCILSCAQGSGFQSLFCSESARILLHALNSSHSYTKD